ncbi:hypothetical protein TSUD_374110 [Trifolium subterraneum]|uniref:Reverse transcriptase domain-containing protein n=1 Tax=Trifolium subterraneum TaxID=3900 RepID=A0A2Z6NBF4_TRISU|nr:hypothetical protein TSUD_374110 [Trifolium subterraneum]
MSLHYKKSLFKLKEFNVFQNLPNRIDSLKVRLSTLEVKVEEEVLSEAELEELHEITFNIYSLSRTSASISWQQYRSLCLKEGDANSKYFHSVIASRRRGNAISSIQVDGVTTEGVQHIRQAVFTHFASHFKAIGVDRPRVDNLQFKTLTPQEGGSLTKPFLLEEVKTEVWDCDSYKSPGPDGINFGFIKDFWPELQADIMRFNAEFHRNGKLTKGLNSTFIALIPKVDSPQLLNDFRPISLVGSLYKILAKVLANRLRLVMGSVISESQTAFVKDRQILDGILIANEVVDEAHRTKKELMLFKVDFEKAYDSVDWGYLDAENGGLGVRRLGEFNIALLGKWCWRMLEDKGGLWFRVLVARYGVARGRVREGGRSGSSWWREIVRIHDGVDGGGVELAVNKSSNVAEMFSLGWGNGGEAWEWRRQLWAWEEEMVGEFQVLLHDFILQAQSPDSWIWHLDPVSDYSVRGAYQLLTSHMLDPSDVALDLIWHKHIPLKVTILSWRLLRDRLPAKTNLAIRGIITPAAQLCVAGCGDVETAQHLFISCRIFGSLWSSVRSCIGLTSVDPQNLPDHFLQFTCSSGGLKTQNIPYLN